MSKTNERRSSRRLERRRPEIHRRADLHRRTARSSTRGAHPVAASSGSLDGAGLNARYQTATRSSVRVASTYRRFQRTASGGVDLPRLGKPAGPTDLEEKVLFRQGRHSGLFHGSVARSVALELGRPRAETTLRDHTINGRYLPAASQPFRIPRFENDGRAYTRRGRGFDCGDFRSLAGVVLRSAPMGIPPIQEGQHREQQNDQRTRRPPEHRQPQAPSRRKK